MASPQLQSIIDMLRNRPSSDRLEIKTARAAFEQIAMLFKPAPDITTQSLSANGVPAEWITPPNATDTVVYWLHGGGYTVGSINTHRDMISRIARASEARAFAIDYRLAPEHPFPAAVDDAVTGYRWLLAQGIDPKAVVIGGDSAGGGLTFATLITLRDAGDPLPAAAVTFSPWTDLEGTGESITTRRDADPMIDPAGMPEMSALYHTTTPVRDPRVSPIHADLTGLPPQLIHVGDAEVLLSDATRMADKAKAAGVDTTLEVWDEMIHVFQFFAATLSEGQQAIEMAGEFVKSHVAAKAVA